MAVDIGLISKGGAWFTFSSVEDKPKFQGAEKAIDYLTKNADLYDSLWNEVKSTMGLE